MSDAYRRLSLPQTDRGGRADGEIDGRAARTHDLELRIDAVQVARGDLVANIVVGREQSQF